MTPTKDIPAIIVKLHLILVQVIHVLMEPHVLQMASIVSNVYVHQTGLVKHVTNHLENVVASERKKKAQ